MLHQLPNEIIINIIRNLEFNDKLSLFLTCHGLEKVISDKYLYEELPQLSEEPALRKTLEWFKKKPLYASRVKQLEIETRGSNEKDLFLQLPTVFPNIRQFITNSSFEIESNAESILNWKNTLETFHVYYGWFRITDLLSKNNIFSRLTSLAIPLYPEAAITHPFIPCISREFDFLKNVPLLRDLTLSAGEITLESLENVHSICPQLKSFTLACIEMLPLQNQRLPSTIVPAIELESFKLINRTRIYERVEKFMDYIIDKYTQVTVLSIPFEFKYEDYMDYRDEDEFIRANDEFVSKLPTTIKTLEICPEFQWDSIASLSKTELKLEKLGFYTHYLDSSLTPFHVIMDMEQFEYIKNMDSLKTLTVAFNTDMAYFYEDLVLENVTTLTTKIAGADPTGECDLDLILWSFPMLKTLHLTSFDTEGPTDETSILLSSTLDQRTFPKLQKLTIEGYVYDDSVMECIQLSLPNLKELRLSIYGVRFASFCRWHIYEPRTYEENKLFRRFTYEDDDMFELGDHDLDVFDLKLQYNGPYDCNKRRLYLQVKTQKGIQRYTITVKKPVNHAHLARLEDSSKKQSNTITIVCKSIRVFKIDGKDIREMLRLSNSQ